MNRARLVPMENYQKIDLSLCTNNFILVEKQKISANMRSLRSIAIIMGPVSNGSLRICRILLVCFSVDFTEFMLAIALTQSGDLDDRLALAFDMYDFNNNGTSKDSTRMKIIFIELCLFFYF